MEKKHTGGVLLGECIWRKRQEVVHFRLPIRLGDSQLKHMEHSVFSTPAGQTNRVHFGTNTNFDKVQTS